MRACDCACVRTRECGWLWASGYGRVWAGGCGRVWAGGCRQPSWSTVNKASSLLRVCLLGVCLIMHICVCVCVCVCVLCVCVCVCVCVCGNQPLINCTHPHTHTHTAVEGETPRLIITWKGPSTDDTEAPLQGKHWTDTAQMKSTL